MKNIALVISALALNSCINISTNIRIAKGPIEERTIVIPEGATALSASSGADIIVDCSLAPNQVRVKTHSDIFDIIEVEVENQTLSIAIESCSLRAETFEVRIPALAYDNIAVSGGCDFEWHNGIAENLAIEASGGADVELSGVFTNLSIAASGGADANLYYLKAENIDIAASGGSDVELRGGCTNLSIAASGGTDVVLDELFAENTSVSASGGSDVSVYASMSLTINASGGADVYYSGAPTSTNINTSSGASVRRK